jgi:Asp-tRNA(Asn)/Glu-tRNA(Gln) amidotransferase A subunit family amidase
MARAKYLDDYLAEHKKPMGPLHGLPISVKDQVRIKVRSFQTTSCHKHCPKPAWGFEDHI